MKGRSQAQVDEQTIEWTKTSLKNECWPHIKNLEKCKKLEKRDLSHLLLSKYGKLIRIECAPSILWYSKWTDRERQKSTNCVMIHNGTNILNSDISIESNISLSSISSIQSNFIVALQMAKFSPNVGKTFLVMVLSLLFNHSPHPSVRIWCWFLMWCFHIIYFSKWSFSTSIVCASIWLQYLALQSVSFVHCSVSRIMSNVDQKCGWAEINEHIQPWIHWFWTNLNIKWSLKWEITLYNVCNFWKRRIEGEKKHCCCDIKILYI